MRRVAWGVGFVAFACVVAPAAAQYRCPSANGGTYVSSTPCQSGTQARAAAAGSRSSNGIRYFGPAESESRYQPRPPSIGEAPAQLKYMSPRCSALNDALRTAPARGLNYETVTKMRKDYRAECAEDEQEAHGRLSQEMRDKSLQKSETKLSEARQRERTALQQEQCGESKRILKIKQARTDLSTGEKAELERFEANYRGRCG
jgi:hypothetical protein